MSYQFSEKQVDVNGYKICYLEGGISTSEPILFLHGWGVATEPYQEVINVLCDRYKVIAPALPGFGKSDGEKLKWDYDKYTNFLLAFLEKLDIKKIHLIGHSLGGGIGVTLAATVPDMVCSLILVDSTGIPVDPVPKRNAGGCGFACLEKSGESRGNPDSLRAPVFRSPHILQDSVLSKGN